MIENIINLIGKEAVFQRKTVIEGDCSGDTVTWNTVYTVKGALRPLNGNEVKIAEKIGVDAQYKFYCQNVNVTEVDRLYFNNKYYKITFIENPMSMDKFLQIFLKRDETYGNNSNQ